MSTRTVQLKDFSKVLGEFSDQHMDDIKHGVVSGLARSIPDLVAASPVDTGLYAASWDFEADEVRAILGNYAPHAPIIEFGARPYTAPIKPLLEWAKRVLNDPSQPPDYSEEVRALAYGTRAKIEREGMKPRNVLEKMLPTIVRNIQEELERGRR
jgi:hypothetical protein